MADLIPDISKPLRFHWTAPDGTRYWTESGGWILGQAQTITKRVLEHLLGPPPSPEAVVRHMYAPEGESELTEEQLLSSELFPQVHSIVMEVLLKDKSTPVQESND